MFRPPSSGRNESVEPESHTLKYFEMPAFSARNRHDKLNLILKNKEHQIQLPIVIMKLI